MQAPLSFPSQNTQLPWPEILDITIGDNGQSKFKFYPLPFLTIPLDNIFINCNISIIEIGPYAAQEYFPW